MACDGIFPSKYPVCHVLVLLSRKEVCVDEVMKEFMDNAAEVSNI